MSAGPGDDLRRRNRERNRVRYFKRSEINNRHGIGGLIDDKSKVGAGRRRTLGARRRRERQH